MVKNLARVKFLSLCDLLLAHSDYYFYFTFTMTSNKRAVIGRMGDQEELFSCTVRTAAAAKELRKYLQKFEFLSID